MFLYLISQDDREGYDTYSAAVVVAPDAEEARKIHPSGAVWGEYGGWYDAKNGYYVSSEDWTWDPDRVDAKRIGIASKKLVPGVVLASFFHG